ncbi:AfsA-related hotdog domain-containing protein [Nocardia brasiliensis]|uniref:AfsA-related hotdog domain-containing protein n=1 Tax=Nocardia brasiliensis TaxID=37326 RepID=UPI00245890B1|nr:AfsA-related hotdog domain-containing protein [Nocardia brasiliensis]
MPGGGLSFQQTVPRSLAHRRAIGEVFVADTAAAGADGFLAAIQLPRAHMLWADRPAGHHDPLSALEAIRQAVTVIGHRYLGLPASDPGSFQRLTFCVEDLSAFHDDEHTPLEGVVRIRIGHDHGHLADSTFHATLTIGDRLAMTVDGGGTVFARADYVELRNHQRSMRPAEPTHARVVAPIDPHIVGRRDERNVVIGAPQVTADGPQQFTVIIDRRHPSFFDHDYDHVPGPLLLEALRQAAIATVHRSDDSVEVIWAITSAEVNFEGFAELDAAIHCIAGPLLETGFIEVSLEQFGRQITTGRIELTAIS